MEMAGSSHSHFILIVFHHNRSSLWSCAKSRDARFPWISLKTIAQWDFIAHNWLSLPSKTEVLNLGRDHNSSLFSSTEDCGQMQLIWSILTSLAETKTHYVAVYLIFWTLIIIPLDCYVSSCQVSYLIMTIAEKIRSNESSKCIYTVWRRAAAVPWIRASQSCALGLSSPLCHSLQVEHNHNILLILMFTKMRVLFYFCTLMFYFICMPQLVSCRRR